MYNLLVSARENDWEGRAFVVNRFRCVSANEYTDPEVAKRFGELGRKQVSALCELPCVFAYEKECDKDPKFGMLREIKRRGTNALRIEYKLVPCETFVTAGELEALGSQLDIHHWELERTHWAVKDVDLALELRQAGIILSNWASSPPRHVNIDQHQFTVALSFPGEHRGYVKRVAAILEQRLGRNSCFYDEYYEALLARPSLDELLDEIYGKRSNLVVVFVCEEYDAKKWCGIEWRKIRERRVWGNDRDIMFVRVGEGEVSGMSRLDGYVDAQNRTPEEIARLIVQRVETE